MASVPSGNAKRVMLGTDERPGLIEFAARCSDQVIFPNSRSFVVSLKIASARNAISTNRRNLERTSHKPRHAGETCHQQRLRQIHVDFFFRNGFELACRIAKAYASSDAVPSAFRRKSRRRRRLTGVPDHHRRESCCAG